MLKNSNNLHKIFNFLHQAGQLKKTLRYSATEKTPKESVADHSWRLALMAFIIADELELPLNISKAMKIALVHDLAEAITGDIDVRLIFKNKIKIKDKQKNELEAMKKIKTILPRKIGKEIYTYWNQYERGLSPEAKFIKALDKIEALTYLKETGYKTYDEPDLIPTYADKDVSSFPSLKPVLKILKNKIKLEFKKGKLIWKKTYNKI